MLQRGVLSWRGGQPEQSRVSQLRQEALEAIRQAQMAAGSDGAEAGGDGVRGRVRGHSC